MGFFDKFKKTVYDDDTDDEEYGDDNADIKLGGNLDLKVMKPKNLEQALSVIDNLKEGRTVLLNLEGVDPAMCRRIIDLVSGAAYATGSSIKKAANDSYCIAPSGVNMDSEIFESDDQIFSDI